MCPPPRPGEISCRANPTGWICILKKDHFFSSPSATQPSVGPASAGRGTHPYSVLHNGWPSHPHQPRRPQALLTSSWMPSPMAFCQVLMMASESCWIRYSEPSRLRSWRDRSHSVISGSPGRLWGQASVVGGAGRGDTEMVEMICPCPQELRAQSSKGFTPGQGIPPHSKQ